MADVNKKKIKKRRIIFSLISYIFIFVGISFILTCSIVLFLQGSPLPEDFIRSRAPRTFSNIFILSFIFTCIVLSIKYYYFDRQIDSIRNATKQFTKGNYSYKIYSESKLHGAKNSELEYIIEDINKISNQFMDLENLQNSFLSNVSHEIKTPLTVIQGYADLLQNKELSAEKRCEYTYLLSEAIGKRKS